MVKLAVTAGNVEAVDVRTVGPTVVAAGAERTVPVTVPL
jgi:hypothetical protein